jgi:hypothetical protein
MKEHIQDRLDQLRLYYSLERDSIQLAIQSALIVEYQAFLDFLSKPEPPTQHIRPL